MKTIGASRFKATCLSILDELGPEGIVITKHGKPVAKLIPVERSSEELVGSLADQLTIKGDIMSTGERWDAES